MKDLVGMEYRQARVLLTDMGLDLKITTETVSSDKYGADAVIETVPAADEPLVAGQTVILRVSTGPETVTVPPLPPKYSPLFRMSSIALSYAEAPISTLPPT